MTSNVTVENASLRYDPFGGRVSVYLFGRPLDWNIGGDEAEEAKKRLGIAAKKLGVSFIFAPRPAKFNAEIVSSNDLLEPEEICDTKDQLKPVVMFRGVDADGILFPNHSELPDGKSAFWLSSADCITIVACHEGTGKLVAAHGGRDCLVDKARISNGTPRKHESVVHAIADQFSGMQRKNLKVFMTCGIGPEHFDHRWDHATYGAANTRMVFDIWRKWGPACLYGDPLEGRISLSEVIRSQFISLGVGPHNIGNDIVDTYTDTDQNGELRWWSNRRGDGKKRNGVLVVQNW